MIHYTLLPEKEIKILKREYRTRLLIILLFFISFAILIGIGSLIPAYLLSSSQEKEAIHNLQEIKNERQTTGVSDILKDLTTMNETVKKIKGNYNPIISSDLVAKIISYKTPKIMMTSFQFTTMPDTAKNATTTTTQIIVQGRSEDREALINFKESIERGKIFSKVELPISDLTKNKDIPFSVRLTIISQK